MVRQYKTNRGLFNDKLSRVFARILSILFGLIIFTVLMHLLLQIVYHFFGNNNIFLLDLSNRFGLDEELSFPTWVNSMLAFIGFVFSFLVFKYQKTKNSKFIWGLISLGCLLISIDEVMALHELILQSIHILANFGESQTWLSNAWLLVLPVILAVVGIFLKLAYKNLPRETFVNLSIGITVYLTGALVVEYISIPILKTSLMYNLVAVVLEESLELIGVWLVIRAVLSHISRYEKTLNERLAELIDN